MKSWINEERLSVAVFRGSFDRSRDPLQNRRRPRRCGHTGLSRILLGHESSGAVMWIFAALIAFLHAVNSPASVADEGPAQANHQMTFSSRLLGDDPQFVTCDLLTKQIKPEFPEPINGVMPAWSPDGTKLAFVRDRGICVVDAHNSKLLQLTDDEFDDYAPAWSPAGDAIAFSSRDEVNSEIVTMDPVGRELRNVTNHPGWDCEPAWCPDGKRLLMTSDRGLGLRLYVMGVDGSDLRRLATSIECRFAFPTWSPDGRMIAFTGATKDNLHVFVCDAEGHSVRQLTTDGMTNMTPVWSPDGRYIAYCRLENPPEENTMPGDLMIFDVVTETHSVVLRATLWEKGDRIAWKPRRLSNNVDVDRDSR